MLRYSRRYRGRSDEDVQLFVSQSDMTYDSSQSRKGRQPKLELQREYSDLTKQKHEEIVKKLLDDFDLEETEDRYRGAQSPITYLPKSKGLGDHQFRSNLRKLMGSDVIHLNDRKWNDKLHFRLRQEYEKQLDRKEEELAEAEVNRIRRLKLDGIIPITDDNNVNNHHGKKKTARPKSKRRKGSHTRRKRSPSPRRHRTRSNSAPSKTVSFYRPPEDISTQVGLDSSSSQSRSTEDGRELREGFNNKSRDEDRYRSVSTDNVRDGDVHGQTSTANTRRKTVPKEVTELFEEETVDGLYTLAERLVVKPRPLNTVRVSINDAVS